MSSMVQYKVVINNFKILDVDSDIVVNGKIFYKKELDMCGEKVFINVSLQSKEDESNIFILEVNSEKDLYEQELMPLAKKIVNDLLNKIAFYYDDAKVGEPLNIRADFKDKKIGTSGMVGSLCVNNEIRDKNLIKKLSEEIKEDKDFDKEEYNLFRYAMNNQDIVVKYMFLYQILSYKYRNNNGYESQKVVDEFIRSKFSVDKHMYKKWEDTGREETIYTRLRNQVGHFRGKTSSETRSAMERKINELIELVKISIAHASTSHT